MILLFFQHDQVPKVGPEVEIKTTDVLVTSELPDFVTSIRVARGERSGARGQR